MTSSLRDRLYSRLIIDTSGETYDETACLLWTGSTQGHGYGQIHLDRINGHHIMGLIHRVAWELVYGPITDDLTVNHLCKIKHCGNVNHMELLPRSEHSRKDNVRPTHCCRGHLYTPENSYWSGSKRRCRTCTLDHQKRYRLAKKASVRG